MKIDKARYEEAYKCARKVYAKQMRITDAMIDLQGIGLNPNSAADFIYNFKHMLHGEIYKRAMSSDATEDFILWIRRDYGGIAFRNSLFALSKHIPFNGGAMNGHLAILKKYGERQVAEPEIMTAVDDLDDQPIGNNLPDRAKQVTYIIERDNKVRAYVARRAKGKCEYCGYEGFPLPSGQKYVEAHHIIALANSGSDTLNNVIALCANHHREAHYGIDAEGLEAKLVQRLSEINNPNAC
jgi:hypothetical protein